MTIFYRQHPEFTVMGTVAWHVEMVLLVSWYPSRIEKAFDMQSVVMRVIAP